MSLNLSNIKWGWVALGIVIAFVIAYGSSICVVTVYATYLGFQARGAPDMTLINEFAARSAGGMTSIFMAVGTLAGGLLAGRKASADAFQNGLMVGLITALIDLVLGLFGGFSLWSIVSSFLAAGGGWPGGRLAARR
jgi:hypothetical protein